MYKSSSRQKLAANYFIFFVKARLIASMTRCLKHSEPLLSIELAFHWWRPRKGSACLGFCWYYACTSPPLPNAAAVTLTVWTGWESKLIAVETGTKAGTTEARLASPQTVLGVITRAHTCWITTAALETAPVAAVSTLVLTNRLEVLDEPISHGEKSEPVVEMRCCLLSSSSLLLEGRVT